MTNDKTVTMSRDLAENIFAWLSRANERNEADDIPEWIELRTLLAAPVVERQEPVAWMYLERSEDGYEYRPLFSPTKWLVLPDGFYEEIELYTSPPALVPVALPEYRKPTLPGGALTLEDAEWNACLDKVKELNR